MDKKSFKKHNRVESKQSRQEEKDDYDNSDAKKNGNSDFYNEETVMAR